MFIDDEYEKELEASQGVGVPLIEAEDELIVAIFDVVRDNKGEQVVVDNIRYIGEEESMYHDERWIRPLIENALGLTTPTFTLIGTFMVTVFLRCVSQTDEEDTLETIEGTEECSYRLVVENTAYEFTDLILSPIKG